ncbi:MAG TPA: uracil-DNA glycosylase [Paludibacteraceae bacterium]|jgi:uracil-DNA glycosylase|nr:uracil-DNA glycosylase [Paludibacteraceae bacterium]HOS36982.1 uracil-DNA glycosylase [Paludibacteraceae bacterium]
MKVTIEQSWEEVLCEEFNSPYFYQLVKFVKQEYATKTIFPPGKLIFNAFNLCPFDKVKVVILGQDPYHNFNQAHGLSFSVNDGVEIPPSLVNIYKEIESELGIKTLPTGNLERWAKQGVLLLNATLTVQAHMAGSHQGKGWERFTDAVIQTLVKRREHLVFMLWGNYAQQKSKYIDKSKHLVLTAVHPSPLSAYRGFFGCGHFRDANDYLIVHGLEPIDWR